MKDFNLNTIKSLIVYTMSYETKPTGDSFIDNRYQQHIDVSGHSWPYYRLFYYLSKVLKPKFVVELGGYQGTAAAHFASGNNTTTVITIDHHTDPGDDINQEKMLDACSYFPNMEYIQGWTVEQVAHEQKGKHALGDALSALPQVMEILDGHSIDILFIDSWHQYEYAMLDWEAYSPFLAKPSLVICDDIIGGYGPAIGGMLDFWNELSGEKFLDSRVHPNSNMGFIKYDNR